MCVSPLKGFQIGFHDSGKPKYLITSYNTNHVEKVNNKYIPAFTDFISPYSNKTIKEFTEIPCGKCLECRLAYSRMWADRMMLEAQEWNENYFVTLTYDNKHLRTTFDGWPTLDSRDLQLFMKRLRKHFKAYYDHDKIRFYSAGEYGDKSFRPHYHLILFNLPLKDLEVYAHNREFTYYNSKTLEDLWPYGYVVIAPVSWDTCAYTARYVVKKQKGKTKDYYKFFGVEPEFCRMSRKPGLGRNYFEKHKDEIYTYDRIYLSDLMGGRSIKPSRYFDKLLETVEPERYNMIKAQRRALAEQNRKLLLSQTQLTIEQIFENRKRAIEKRTAILKRVL